MRRLGALAVLCVTLAGCASAVDGAPARGPKNGDQAFFFAGQVPLYGQSPDAGDTAYLGYLRALRRIDVCGLLTGNVLAKVGQTDWYGTSFDFGDCDAQLKVSGASGPQLVSAQLQMSHTVGATPAFEVGHTGVIAGEDCSWLVPVPLSRLPGAPPQPASAQPTVIVSEVGGEDCNVTKPLATALAARVDSGPLPPRDAAASYPVRLADRDPCEVISALPGDVTAWSVHASQPYECEFTVRRGGRDAALDVGLRPQVVGTQGKERVDASGTEVYLDPPSCSAVAFVGPPMQRRLADSSYVDVPDSAARPAVVVDDQGGHDCDVVSDIAVKAASLYG